MKTNLSKNEAKEKIEKFFNKEELDVKAVKKIKRLAMKYNIKLGDKRKRFCKKCLSDLKHGAVRVNKMKSVECVKCGFINRWKIKN